MAESTVVLRQSSDRTKSVNISSGIFWAVCGLAMELGAGASSVGASAAAAGLGFDKAVWVYAGGAVGAALHGFPIGFQGLSSLLIAFVGGFIPKVRYRWLNNLVKGFVAAAASFFPRLAEYDSPAELLSGIILAITSAIFAVCISVLYGRVKLRGFDGADSGDNALAAVIAAAAFMTLGRLDYPLLNIGSITAGFLLLAGTQHAIGYAVGVAALFGLCASGSVDVICAGAVCLAAVLSGSLGSFGKITRGIGFVFFGCALILSAGADGNHWKTITEMIIAAALYMAVPQKLLARAESDRADNSAALMIKERLCFAAGAFSGVNNGLEAAADTLERRYTENISAIADKAADKICRSCPNNMVCWSRKYELFHGEFNRLVKLIRTGAELTELSLSPPVAAECINKGGVISGIKKAYEQYLSASGRQLRTRELRRIFSEQLSVMSGILNDMGNSAGRVKSGSRIAERKAEKVLRDCGLTDPCAFVTFTKGNRLRLEAYAGGELNTDREYLGELLIRALGRQLDLPEICTSGNRVRVTAVQMSVMSAEIGAFQLCKGKNRVCGDCYDSFTDPNGILYVILSDGMGSGSRARIDSAMVCTMTAKLIKSGISLPAVLETVNTSLMVKSADESFATLDICRLDLNNGDCTIYKAGAAASYIKCSDRLLRTALSSPPAGTGGRISLPAQRFHVSVGDIIIMTTDGAAIDEEWLSRELSAEHEPPAAPRELSERIARAARCRDSGREDDISIITLAIGR